MYATNVRQNGIAHAVRASQGGTDMASHINLDAPFIHKVTFLCDISNAVMDFTGNRIANRHIIAKGNLIEGIKAIE